MTIIKQGRFYSLMFVSQ